MLRNFLRIVEQLFRLTEISDDRQKLDWLISYVEADIANQWSWAFGTQTHFSFFSCEEF